MGGVGMLIHKVKSLSRSSHALYHAATIISQNGWRIYPSSCQMTGLEDPLCLKHKRGLLTRRRAKCTIKLTSMNPQAEHCKSRAGNPRSLNTSHQQQHRLIYSHLYYFLAPEPESLSFPLLGASGWDRTASLPSSSLGSSYGQHRGGIGRHRQPRPWAPAWRRWPSPWRRDWALSGCWSCPSVSYWAAALHGLARSWHHSGPYLEGPELSQWSRWASGLRLYIQRWYLGNRILR